MNKENFGNMINYERTKCAMSIQELTVGLCSISTLQRLESGVRLPDFFLIERLVERLGISVNKLEFLYDETDYEIYYLRELIEKSMGDMNYVEVEDVIQYYEELDAAKKPLHRQYIQKIQGVIASERDHNHEKAADFYWQALGLTVPGFSLESVEDHILGEGELVILLLWIQEESAQRDFGFQTNHNQILSYIERRSQDEEVRANVYSKAAWTLGTLALQQKNKQDALWYTQHGLEALTENGLLMHVPQFLDRMVKLTVECDSCKYEEMKKQRDALRYLYEEYYQPWDSKRILLWKNFRQMEIYLLSEVFAQSRKMQHYSQEKLADVTDLDQKTISRIETGKYKPKAGTLKKMRECLQIDRDICATRLVVQDFQLLELQWQVAKLRHYNQNVEAEKIYIKLKNLLSLKYKENKQYVKYMDMIFDREFGRITLEEAISRGIEAYCITKEQFNVEELERIVPSRIESNIINYLSTCYKKIGKVNDAITILEKVAKAYERSDVDIKYHYAPIMLIYENLMDAYEIANFFDKAVKIGNILIELEFRCQRALSMGFVYSEKEYALNRKQRNRSQSKPHYQIAYQVMKLMHKTKQMKALRKAYREWYDEEIDEQN